MEIKEIKKYIKTRSCIYEVVEEDQYSVRTKTTGEELGYISKKIIVKTSDNIEDLIDLYVLETYISDDYSIKITFINLDAAIDCMKIGDRLFGGVWGQNSLNFEVEYFGTNNNKNHWKIIR